MLSKIVSFRPVSSAWLAALAWPCQLRSFHHPEVTDRWPGGILIAHTLLTADGVSRGREACLDLVPGLVPVRKLGTNRKDHGVT